MVHRIDWRLGARALAVAAVVLAAQGARAWGKGEECTPVTGEEPERHHEGKGIDEVVVTPETPALTCPEATACFDVTAEHNITHIFLSVDFDQCQETPIHVTVDGREVTRFHEANGGPCEKQFPGTIWFPLTGNQKTARVCVSTPGSVPKTILVGAKAQSECEAATVCADNCSNCGQQQCPPANQDP